MENDANRLKAGVAQADITPPVGIPLTGYIMREGNSEGVHDRLYAKALVLGDGADPQGERQAAVVICDVLALDQRFVASARADIQEATGIPGSHVMIACTHTHSGPATIYLRDCGEVDEAWLTLLRRRLVEVTEAARSNLRAVRLSAGRGYFAEGVRNRRVPDGVMDPELGVLRIQDERGQMMAVLLNYACHPTSVHYDNRLISADYPGYVMEAVQRETGAVALFATGAVGDVGPSTERGFPTAEALGSALAAEALRVLDGITVEDRRGIAVATETLNLPLEALPSIEEMEQIVAESRRLLMEAQAASEPLRAKICRAMLGWSEATLVAQSADYPKGLRKLREGRAPKSVSTQVQVICLGDLALVGVPGELFVELGLAIKRDAGARQVFVCGYANDDVGYLPTRQAYAQGGYEVREAFKYYGYPAALAPEAGEQMVEAAVRLIRRCLGD